MTFFSKFYRKYMGAHNRALILYDLIFNAVFVVFILPIIENGLRLVMKSWGESYITDKNLLSFILYPPSILFLILSILAVFIFIFWKMVTHIQYCNNSHIEYGKKNVFTLSVVESLNKTLEFVSLDNIMLPIYAVLQYVFMIIPVLIGLTMQIKIPAYLTKGASDQLFMRSLIIIILIFISFLAIRGLFTIHICVNEHVNFQAAMKRSKKLMKGNYIKVILKLLFYNLILFIGLYFFYYFILFLIAMVIYLTVENTFVISVFLNIYSKSNIYIIVLFSMISYITNLNLISTIYHDSYQEKGYKNKKYQVKPISTKYRGVKMLIIFTVFAIGITNFIVTIKNDTIHLKETLSGMQIVSHRGYSSNAPENTLPAIEQAIQAHVDYVEIDVQQTKDGTLVLFHDMNLRRITGVNQLLRDVNYEDIKDLDAGSWFSQEYSGTHIPTVEEVLELCKGRINISFELKIYKHGGDLEEKLVSLIEEYDFVENCFVSSFNYDSLVRIKQLNENITTGYIISPAYGNFYDKPHIDFLSIRASLVNRTLVENAHMEGKEVHVWTVNRRRDFERMISLGVDYVITDHPQLAREVLLSNDTTDTFIEMLNTMLSY